MDEFEVWYKVFFTDGKLPEGWPDITEEAVREFSDHVDMNEEDYIPDWPFSELQDYALEQGLFDLSGAPDWFDPEAPSVDWFSYDARDHSLELSRPWFN